MIVARVTGSDQQRGLVVKMAEEKPKAADDGHKGKKGAEEKRAPGNERAAWRGVKSGEPDAPRDWKPKAIGRLSAYFAVALLLAFVAVKMGRDGGKRHPMGRRRGRQDRDADGELAIRHFHPRRDPRPDHRDVHRRDLCVAHQYDLHPRSEERRV